MVTIELRFPAGRYHATAWGRHVNEGVPEWPPAPYRMARALIDIWHRRRAHWPQERIAAVLETLSPAPNYELPPSTVGHLRAYMAQRTSLDKQPVFDAFVVLDPGARVRIHFESTPSGEVRADLAELLAELDYLGRSQSWVDAELIDTPAGSALPRHPGPQATKERVACVAAPQLYAQLEAPPTIGKGKKARPLSWVEALSLSSNDVQKLSWTSPPALQWVDVSIPQPESSRSAASTRSRLPIEACYRLNGKVLPRVQETISLAERARRILMGHHKRIEGGDEARISLTFAGKAPDGTAAQGHQHAYFLPYDADGDGRIDHLLVRAQRGFVPSEQRALDECSAIWQSNGKPELRLALTRLSFEQVPVARRWRSATPFIAPRHYRRGRGALDQWLVVELLRECEHHGLPKPCLVEPLADTGGRLPLRWFEFMRSRRGDRPHSGFGFSITFEEPVAGPFALGYAAHFGLGLFLPDTP